MCSFVFGASIMQDKELGEYSPSHSSTSKRIPCSHELCEMGPNCKMPLSHCPYSVIYLSEDTSRSGYLFEDQLHLVSVGGNKQQGSIQASILIGYIHLLDTWLSNVSHLLSKVFGYVCFASEIFLLKYPSDNF